jgi:hypothetical protein
LADRFAAVHASAAAPALGNEVGQNLLNTRFTYMIGEHDTSYGRIERCRAFDEYMKKIRGERKDVYPVTMEYQAGFGHGGLPDRDKIKDMYSATRKPAPDELCWLTTYAEVEHFNWLHVPKPAGGKKTNATIKDNQLSIKTENLDSLEVRFDERLVDYSKELTVEANGRRSTHKVAPSLRALCETLAERGDPELMFATRLAIECPPPDAAKK